MRLCLPFVLSALLAPHAAGAAPAAATWLGTFGPEWHVAGNWSNLTVPSAGSAVVIPAGTLHSPEIQIGSVAIEDLTLHGGATLTLVGGGDLEVADDLVLSGTVAAAAAGSLVRVGGDLSLIHI